MKDGNKETEERRDKGKRQKRKDRKERQRTETETRKGWSVTAYVCGVKTRSCGSQATSWFTGQKQHKEKNSQTRPENFEPMQSVALPCVQW